MFPPKNEIHQAARPFAVASLFGQMNEIQKLKSKSVRIAA